MNLKGTRTEANVSQAFMVAGSAMSVYALCAEAARREGAENIAKLLEDSAHAKLAHARLIGSEFDKIKDTKSNLEMLMQYERQIWAGYCPQYAAIARSEGFHELAEKMDKLAELGKAQEETLKTFYTQLEMSTMVKGSETVWKCRFCGDIDRGAVPPEICPICEERNTHEELKSEIVKFVTGM